MAPPGACKPGNNVPSSVLRPPFPGVTPPAAGDDATWVWMDGADTQLAMPLTRQDREGARGNGKDQDLA
eukprot:4767338-Prorocentrum_lima.AAC.1